MSACSIKVRGVVQGVGFRPFVFRLARANTLAGWVWNGDHGVEIFIEGADGDLEAFVHALETDAPPAALITNIEVQSSKPLGLNDFSIRQSERTDRISTRISPDLSVCADCLRELFDTADRRYLYPYINCTNCGPRYSVILGLPYDRPNTTMRNWPLDEVCAAQYHDPTDRRFHAQPIACASCGPGYRLVCDDASISDSEASIRHAAELLQLGKILAVKGLGGYHLACDAKNAMAVKELRNRKYRKEKPFAIMARDIDVARTVIRLCADSEVLLTSTARPIVIAPAVAELAEVAPDNHELGVMLPYTPLHHLLFEFGAPGLLVMTSANRSSEPIAYDDTEALQTLAGIADGFLIGERPIARRVDDSICRAGVFGPTILRRARGYAPSAAAVFPGKNQTRPILAVGADLKNTITLVVEGQALMSQHVGDLSHHQAFESFQKTVADLVSMYEIDMKNLLVLHDCHPQYASTTYAQTLSCGEIRSVQHHRAHVASVLAECGEWGKRVIGISFDGTGYGDDATIWGGEIFAGSLAGGFERIAHLRTATLPGGDAAARHPVQAAAGFLWQLEKLPEMARAPFNFPTRYDNAQALIRNGVRTFPTTSVGRLFDCAAALVGFTREVTFEGQAAIWLEQLAREMPGADAYPFPFIDGQFDFRPLLQSVVSDRLRGRHTGEIARAFHLGIAEGVCGAMARLCRDHSASAIVLSGGVFQNELLLRDLHSLCRASSVEVLTNRVVPANDGGISLGQAALAWFGHFHHSSAARA